MTPPPRPLGASPWLALVLGLAALAPIPARAGLGDDPLVAGAASPGAFALAAPGSASPICASAEDWPGVLRAARDLQADVERVTGTRPAVSTGQPYPPGGAVLVGTVGRSALIDGLAAAGKLDVSAIRGKWESFLIQVVDNPLPGVDRALVVAGSDKRGTIYGIYEISEQIGVSPWYWWADVPARHRDALYVPPVRRVEGEPAVRYRGIFLNDEAPALAGWTLEKFGGFNHAFYERVFELLLRLRANFLWPAMWDNAFNEDDPLNPKLADEYGIVMGTSHHEPMLRAQQEWKRHGSGPWDYSTNAAVLQKFWSEGVRRNRGYESITTIGMRGDGDKPMSEDSNIALLERIVADQRAILAREVNPDVTKIPQVWALYKEVQEYFEKGMRVPDDVTLLWCDDNWGNLRRLPTPAERTRPGGAGIYYHLDYVGGPRSYKWLGTYPITKVWEQMHLAHEYDANRIWIVNVGDLKPMEFPMEFFLRYAWAPDRWPSEKLGDFGRAWAEREFGPEYAQEIASIVAAYTKYNGRCKPEDLSPDTFSIVNYGEADRVVAGWNQLVDRAMEVRAHLPAQAQDAFAELVLHPVQACAVVTELYVAAAHNRLDAVQGRASTNGWAAHARDLFAEDARLTRDWDEKVAGGKWLHMMDQTHLGYTNWQEPVRNAMPAVTEIQLPAEPQLGVAIDGSPYAWPNKNGDIPQPVLPEIGGAAGALTHVDVFNRGGGTLDYEVQSSVPWIHISPDHGRVSLEQRLDIRVDPSGAPAGLSTPVITVTSPTGRAVRITVPVRNTAPKAAVFNEANGCVAIEAPHFSRATSTQGITWKVLDDFGRTLGGVTPFPVTAEPVTPGGGSPHLEFDFQLHSSGTARVELTLAPTVNFTPGHGLRFAVSLDDEAPLVQEIVADVGNDRSEWAESVLAGVRKMASMHPAAAGGHVLKFWMVDPGVVLERVVVNMGGERPSYLGPPETPENLVP